MPRPLRTVPLITLLLTAATSCPGWAACGSELVSPVAARNAVDFVTKTVAAAHVGSLAGLPPPVARSLAKLRERSTSALSAAHLAAELNGALAGAADGHLAVRLRDSALPECRALPISLAWTAAGLFVRGGGGLPAGTRLLSLGRYDLEELDAVSRRLVPGENAFWSHAEFARIVTREDVLVALDVVRRDGKVRLTFERPGGSPGEALLAFVPGSPAAAPIASSDFYPADSAAVLKIHRLELEPALIAAIKEFFARAARENIRKIGIDLRGNPGGDSSVAIAVLRELGIDRFDSFAVDVRVSPQLIAEQPAFDPQAVSPVFTSLGLAPIPPSAHHYLIPAPLVAAQLAERLKDFDLAPIGPRELYLLVDGGTFSSAALFAQLVRDNHLGMLIGEPIGNATPFNGSEIHADIPGLPYYLNLSTARLIRPDPVAGPASTLVPDVFAPLTPGAAAAGIDPALDLMRHR